MTDKMDHNYHRSRKLSRRKSSVLPLVVVLVIVVAIAVIGFTLIKRVLPANTVVDNNKMTNETVVDKMFVQLGHYPQSDISGSTKDPIDWIILETTENGALLLSEHILDCKCYNNEFKDITWEECDLRNWLNNDFYNTAFDENEQNLVLTADIINDDNKEYGTKGGNNTKDKVFCLSIDEIKKYYKVYDKKEHGYDIEKEALATGTAYAKNVTNGGSKLWVSSENDEYNGYSSYWLRSPGYFQNCAACVLDNAFLDESNIFQGVTYSDYGVRPAIWMRYK